MPAEDTGHTGWNWSQPIREQDWSQLTNYSPRFILIVPYEFLIYQYVRTEQCSKWIEGLFVKYRRDSQQKPANLFYFKAKRLVVRNIFEELMKKLLFKPGVISEGNQKEGFIS